MHCALLRGASSWDADTIDMNLPDNRLANVQSSPVLAALREIHANYRRNVNGKVASYIPELAKADPNLFGIALVAADGQIYQVGDADQLFTIQSISKPFVYGFALEDHGIEHVLRKVGVEPTGEAFNSIVFDERNNRPFNPMVNAGAIATTALIKGIGHDQRLTRLLEKFSALAGRALEIDHAVYVSERTTGHRNRAIGYLELNFGMVEEPITEHLDLYFEQCSILVSARDLAVMAATLANNGVNPVTGRRAFEERYVQNVLSVMHSCGMYDYAGEWSYRIGLPAKSGVGGGIIAVLPGQFGIGIFSAPLDDQGNSARGIQVCEELSERFKLHMFKSRSATAVVVRRVYRGTAIRSKHRRGNTEEALLTSEGAAICVFELQGNLYFGTAERVIRRITSEMASFTYLVLDLKRVLQIDECAAALLEQTSNMLQARHKKLLLTHLPDSCGDLFDKEPRNDSAGMQSFPDIDAALEWCEDRVLEEKAPQLFRESRLVELAGMNILAGFDDNELALLKSLVKEENYDAGAWIIREGEPADALYLLAAGRVSISLAIKTSSRRQRLSTISPGLAFGELGVLDGGNRSADAIADEPTRCFVLPIAQFQALTKCHPKIANKLNLNIARELSTRLRRADAEIRSLAE
jgi:glutaminase